MINVKGSIKLNVPFDVTLDIDESLFNSMNENELFEQIDGNVDWNSILQESTLENVDITDVVEE